MDNFSEKQPSENNVWKILTICLIVLLLLAGVAIGSYYVGQKSNEQNPSTSEDLNSKQISSGNSKQQAKTINSELPRQAEVVTQSMPTVTQSEQISQPQTISGEVFVVTRGRQNIKLALVDICAVSEGFIQNWLRAKQNGAVGGAQGVQKKIEVLKNQLAKAKADLSTISSDDYSQRFSAEDKVRDIEFQIRLENVHYDYWYSPEYYLKDLVQCEAKAKTDSDGKFSLNLPAGKRYAIAAQTDRKVFDSSETYWWLLWTSGKSGNEQLNLNNENLMATNPTNAVIRINR